MIWMSILSGFVLVSLVYALRKQKRRGLLVSGIITFVVLGSTSYLYWNLGAYEMTLSTEALNDLPEKERAYVIAQAAQDEFLSKDREAESDIINLFQLALDLDPNQVTALGSLGIIAFENRNFSKAEAYWTRMLMQLPAESEEAMAISAGITRAREEVSRIKRDNQKLGASEISVTLTLGRTVPASMASATVFVFAREVQGSSRPLVAKRLPVSQLPTTVTLSNADAVMGGGLFNDQLVEVNARLTLGEATGARGDWMSEPSIQTLKKKNTVKLTLVPPVE